MVWDFLFLGICFLFPFIFFNYIFFSVEILLVAFLVYVGARHTDRFLISFSGKQKLKIFTVF